MGQDTDQLSTTPADIEATRADLSRNLDELGDKVSPQRVVERRKLAAKNSLSSVREKVMGTAQDAKGSHGSGSRGSASGAADSVKDSAQAAAGSLGSATAGNPLTAGLVAFGAGMLISALLPASTKETDAARRVVDTAKEHGQPLLDHTKSVGQDLGQDLGDKAAQAAQEVKAQAQDSAANLKQEGQSSVDQVKDEAPSS
jgi:gas vesicle protein